MELTFNNRIYVLGDLIRMRNWLNLYVFIGYPTSFINQLTNWEVLQETERYYIGGAIQFNNDYYAMIKPPFMVQRMVIIITKNADTAIVHFIVTGKLKKVAMSMSAIHNYKQMLLVKKALVITNN